MNAAPTPETLVYYAGVGDRIKIGKSTATNLSCRMSCLKAEVLLAVEPGSYDLERDRHEQFSHYNLDGEWFAPGPALLNHIESLMGLYVLPRIPRRTPSKSVPRPRKQRQYFTPVTTVRPRAWSIYW